MLRGAPLALAAPRGAAPQGAAPRAPRAPRAAPRRGAVAVRAANQPPQYPAYVEQALMEKRLLEKLLYDKRRELEAYDVQLEEYMRLSTQRAAAGSQPLVPAGRTVVASLTAGGAAATAAAVAPGAAAAAAALAAPRQSVPSAAGGGAVSQKEVLQKLLAEKRAELARANAEVNEYSSLLAARSSPAPAQPPPPPAVASFGSGDASERVRSLEALLASELRRKEEQIALNEELLRINEEQVRTNEELVRKLQQSQALASAAASAAAPSAPSAPVAVDGPQPEFVYSVGDPLPQPAAAAVAAAPAAAAVAAAPAVAPAPVAKQDDMLVVQADDGTQVLYRRLGRVLERPGGLGVVALGLVSSIGPAVAGAVNVAQELSAAAAKSETMRIKK